MYSVHTARFHIHTLRWTKNISIVLFRSQYVLYIGSACVPGRRKRGCLHVLMQLHDRIC